MAQARYYLPAGGVILAALLVAGHFAVPGPMQTAGLIALGVAVYFALLAVQRDAYMKQAVALLRAKIMRR